MLRSISKTGFRTLVILNLICLSGANLHAQTSEIKPDVLAFSGTTQGNGYNWSASLSWLGEQLHNTAVEARELEHRNGKPVSIEIVSFSGGSSGSAVANTFDTLLANRNLLGQPKDVARPRRLTPDQAERLASGLKFIALGSGMHPLFSITTLQRAIDNDIVGSIDKLSDQFSFIPDLIGQGKINLWTPQMAGKIVISDFGRFIYGASILEQPTTDLSIEKAPGYDQWQKLARQDAKFANYFQTIHEITDPLNLPLGATPMDAKLAEQLKKFQQWQASAARLIFTQAIRSHVGRPNDDFRRFLDEMTPPNQVKLPLNPDSFVSALGNPLGDGVFTCALAAEFKSDSEMSQEIRKARGLDYSQLRAYVFMNQRTAEKLLSSDEYRKAVMSNDPWIQRYVIAVVDQRWASLNASVREPGLLDELYGKLSADNLRIRAIFDPKSGVKEKFHLSSTKAMNRSIFVVGGFPFPRIISFLQAIYHKDQVRRMETSGEVVESRFHLLEKEADFANPKSFAGRSIMGILNTSKNPEVGAKNLKDWAAWSQNFEDKHVADLQKGGGKWVVTVLNWDISTLPAAVMRLNYILVAKAENAAREAWARVTNPSLENSVQKVFDPQPARGEIAPKPPLPIVKAVSDGLRQVGLICRDLFK